MTVHATRRGPCTRAVIALALGLGACVLLPGIADAHQASITHSRVRVLDDRRAVEYDLKFEPEDVSEALGLGVDVDPTDTQVAAGQDRLLDYVLERVRVTGTDGACPVERLGASAVQQGSRFVQVAFRVRCARPIDTLVIDYRLFFDLDSLHRGLLQVRHGDASAVAEFTDRSRVFTWQLDRPPPSSRLAFVKSGVEHIAFGFDHIAFVIGLLLVVTIARASPDGAEGEPPDGPIERTPADIADGRHLDERAAWQLRGLGPGLRYTAAIVTSFTVAHSLTLIAASLGWIELPSRVVESAVAASIVYIGVDNIVRPDARYRYALTFVFGLVHGLGFASMLRVLLPPEHVIGPLLMFNIGVELGQLAIVIAVLPVLHIATRALTPTGYREWFLPLGSGVLAVLGLAWMVERVFDTTLLGF